MFHSKVTLHTGLPNREFVCAKQRRKHREFAFASGEMSKTQFTGFLAETLGNIARAMRDGAWQTEHS